MTEGVILNVSTFINFHCLKILKDSKLQLTMMSGATGILAEPHYFRLKRNSPCCLLTFKVPVIKKMLKRIFKKSPQQKLLWQEMKPCKVFHSIVEWNNLPGIIRFLFIHAASKLRNLLIQGKFDYFIDIILQPIKETENLVLSWCGGQENRHLIFW